MLRLLALTLPLSFDTFAISAAIGMLNMSARERMRLGMILASFEAAMPLVGLGVGEALAAALGPSAAYVASASLVAIGTYLMLGDDDEARSVGKLGSVRGLALLAVGIAVSLDELAIGLSIGLLGLPVAGRSRSSRFRRSSPRSSAWHSGRVSARASAKVQNAPPAQC